MTLTPFLPQTVGEMAFFDGAVWGAVRGAKKNALARPVWRSEAIPVLSPCAEGLARSQAIYDDFSGM